MLIAKTVSLRTHQIREIAVAAQVDPRTVKRALTGHIAPSMTRERIARALEARGWAHLLNGEAQ